MLVMYEILRSCRFRTIGKHFSMFDAPLCDAFQSIHLRVNASVSIEYQQHTQTHTYIDVVFIPLQVINTICL